ncbi:hypothetical protein BJ875DRAFT_257915 [Amylocarpus encephaloides]|uniref:Uncharacterized protein n=1 Tax=Amylocarpus encephaloides TaxID=45428 RepID=A0A9P7YM73_9HELO|nr:hypothetical protein BJ875DRAFT_257915 [Amylocarpus encephaloides]
MVTFSPCILHQAANQRPSALVSSLWKSIAGNCNQVAAAGCFPRDEGHRLERLLPTPQNQRCFLDHHSREHPRRSSWASALPGTFTAGVDRLYCKAQGDEEKHEKDLGTALRRLRDGRASITEKLERGFALPSRTQRKWTTVKAMFTEDTMSTFRAELAALQATWRLGRGGSTNVIFPAVGSSDALLNNPTCGQRPRRPGISTLDDILPMSEGEREDCTGAFYLQDHSSKLDSIPTRVPGTRWCVTEHRDLRSGPRPSPPSASGYRETARRLYQLISSVSCVTTRLQTSRTKRISPGLSILR